MLIYFNNSFTFAFADNQQNNCNKSDNLASFS